MRYYIAHKFQGDKKNIERVEKIARKLQLKHPENAYFSPLHAFSFLDYDDMPYDDFMEICLDFLSACDVLIVASEISKGVQMEIDFAKLVKMEVMRLDESGKLRPFTE
ncbi:MAG: DUF4406 domain-containing protein [Clostridia bacterium]|nr:DUF4406 domain-containing protein [Clostridia bacterium]